MGSNARVGPPRIAYVQYTDPAAYPPLQHSSRLLSEAGYRVLFLGIRRTELPEASMAAASGITHRAMAPCPPGWRQKLHYLRFGLWVVAHAIRWRPCWVYASDPLSAPIALAMSRLLRVPVIYHEHDSPGPADEPVLSPAPARSRFMRFVLWARRRLARHASLCVLPNSDRTSHLAREVPSARTATVWNCPLRAEVPSVRSRETGSDLVLYYHGNISRERLPITLVAAMARSARPVQLRVVGYEAMGQEGYVGDFESEAKRHGLGDRVRFFGGVARGDLLNRLDGCDVGLALVPMSSPDVNLRYMTGASNKAFEYLACGLALLVSDISEWRRSYVEPGYALAADPGDPDSLASALRWFADHREQMREMGRAGRERIMGDWNYETQFRPVFSEITRSCPR